MTQLGKDGLPVYNEVEQGITEDDIESAPSSISRNQSAALYTGARKSIVESLRGGTTPARAEVVTPAVAKKRQQRGRAAIYLRVSTEEQARVGGGVEGYSIPFQRDACHRKAQEMGIPVIAEYVELGRTATTTSRPEFQRMFAELSDLGITHVIVHKLDRLSRSPKADYFVDSGLEVSRAALVSVSEYIDDTPQGKLNLQIQRGMASYYSNNLATEVIKGLNKKLETGGTPGRAPLGYINRRRIEGTADIRWVEPDPERAHHITWAFTEYSTGNLSLSVLAEALEDRGLRTRATPKVPSRPITVSSLHKLLVNPYFVGVIAYRGVYHEGKHEPLVDMDTWLTVQDVLIAHNAAGEKDRKHPHYLKGSIFCGHCKSRMVYSRNKGKGGTYEYFFCMGRRNTRNPCPRKFTRLSAIEDGVIDFYQRLQLDKHEAEQIQKVVLNELQAERAGVDQSLSAANRKLVRIERERAKLLEAHYAGAIPLDMLKSEMDRLTRELNANEKIVAAAVQSRSEIVHTIKRALGIAQNCHRYYKTSHAKERRMLNQGFFSRLYIDDDGTVAEAELTEPFVHLLALHSDVIIEQRKPPVRPILGEQVVEVDPDAPRALLSRGEREQEQNLQTRISSTLLRFIGHEKTQPALSRGLGLNNELLAVAEGFEPSDGGYPSHAFEACSLGRSDTPPLVTLPDGVPVAEIARWSGIT